MKLELVPVPIEDREILSNLLEKYNYEFSQYDQRKVNNLGLFGYKYLDYYWTENKRWAFFIKVDDHLAGFAMVNDFPEADEPVDYSLSEFFVMFPYRRSGVGKWAAFQVSDRCHGKWQLMRHPKNIPSVHFWNKVVSEYTHGHYRLAEGYPNARYDDGTLGDIFFFEN